MQVFALIKVVFCIETSVKGVGCKCALSRRVSSYVNSIKERKSIFGVCTVYSEITASCFIDRKITQYVLVSSNVVFFLLL